MMKWLFEALIINTGISLLNLRFVDEKKSKKIVKLIYQYELFIMTIFFARFSSILEKSPFFS